MTDVVRGASVELRSEPSALARLSDSDLAKTRDASSPQARPGKIRDVLRFDSSFWRRLAWYGAARGPRWWLRLSPAAIGVLFALLMRQRRRAVRRNLRAAVGEQGFLRETAGIARTFMSFAQSLADGFAMSEGRYQPGIEVIGEAYLTEPSIRPGEGIIVVTAHTAGWEVALPALRQVTRRNVSVVMRPERDLRAGSLHDSFRKSQGVQIVHSGRDPFSGLGLLHCLQDGGVVALQVDRSPAGIRSRPDKFLGRPWAFPEGPFRLAALTGCPLVTTLSCRTGFLRYQVVVSEPIRIPRKPDEATIRNAVAKVAQTLDRFVRQHPTQWFHFSEGPG